MASAATQNPAFVLIDEPELNLHPTLQLDFLTTLGSYAENGVVFATHSVGLARSAADLLYSVRRNPEGQSEVSDYERTPRLAEFLGELSYSEYQELGFKQVLLVEGPTDVQTIQQFLRRDRKDHEVVLLPLGGSSGISSSSTEMQLREIKRISPKVAALVDSERESSSARLPKDRAAFQRACRKAQVRCHILDRRATENYLTEDAIKKVKGQNYRALEPYEALRDCNPAWSKSENWRIARRMDLTDLDGTDLGRFLKSL